MLMTGKTDHERAILTAYAAWVDYANAHRRRFGWPIGEDHTLGRSWAEWGNAILDLLNGETGELDCNRMSREIREFAAANGAAGVIKQQER